MMVMMMDDDFVDDDDNGYNDADGEKKTFKLDMFLWLTVVWHCSH